MRAAIALLTAIVGCGHLDFERSGDGGIVVPSDRIAVHLARGGTVFVENGSDYDRYVTDAQDVAMFPATRPTTFHVVSMLDKHVWSALDVEPGTFVSLRNDLVSDPYSGSMTITLPAHAGALTYYLLADRCAFATANPGPSFTVAFRASCEGTAAHLLASAVASGTLLGYIDLGSVTLVTSVAMQPIVNWIAPTSYSLAVHGLPASSDPLITTFWHLEPARSSSVNLDVFVPPEVPIVAGDATVVRDLPPLLNELELQVGVLGLGAPQSVLRFTPSIAPGQSSIDASAMLPLLANLTASTTTVAASWSMPSAQAADLVAVHIEFVKLDGSYISWDAYAPPMTTTLTYPSLPADVGLAPEPNVTYYYVSVTLVDVIGVDRKAALEFIASLFRFESIAGNSSITGVAKSTIER